MKLYNNFPQSSYVCPNCESENITGYDMDSMDNDVTSYYFTFDCLDCGKSFEVQYTISKIREYVKF